MQEPPPHPIHVLAMLPQIQLASSQRLGRPDASVRVLTRPHPVQKCSINVPGPTLGMVCAWAQSDEVLTDGKVSNASLGRVGFWGYPAGDLRPSH